MIYTVKARFRAETAGAFLANLTDGTIAAQRPDGAEIVAAMRRAVVAEDGSVEWSEMCFCNPPLAHERATVLDRHFADIRTEPADGYQEHEGRPFMDALAELAGQT